MQATPESFDLASVIPLFLLSFLTTLIPAFGEEFGWRGYLLPRLLRRYSVKRSLLIQAFIWWGWHVPVLVFSALNVPLIPGSPGLSILLVLGISLLPSMMHAVIFSYVWSKTNSLGVATFYHASFDEVRDTVEQTIGFGPLTQIWQMAVLTIVGAILFFRSRWDELVFRKANSR
jgi:membrane protease YdiL (CAAX protease family)